MVKKKYEVSIIKKCFAKHPANHFYTTFYNVTATSKEEAKAIAIIAFKKRLLENVFKS